MPTISEINTVSLAADMEVDEPEIIPDATEAEVEGVEDDVEEVAAGKKNGNEKGKNKGKNKDGEDAAGVDEDEGGADGDGQDGDDEEDGGEKPEEEYEVDEIKSSAKQGKNGWQYLVSWVGYGEEHNSWVSEADFGSMDIVDAYWKARGGRPKKPSDVNGSSSSRRGRGASSAIEPYASAEPVASGTGAGGGGGKKKRGAAAAGHEEDSDEEVRPGKRGRTSGPGAGGQRNGKASNRPQEDDAEGFAENGNGKGEYAKAHTESMDAYKDLASWEDQVVKIETVERGSNGRLSVYLLMKNGEKTAQDSETVYKRCPKAMFAFYESHLKWRPVK